MFPNECKPKSRPGNKCFRELARHAGQGTSLEPLASGPRTSRQKPHCRPDPSAISVNGHLTLRSPTRQNWHLWIQHVHSPNEQHIAHSTGQFCLQAVSATSQSCTSWTICTTVKGTLSVAVAVIALAVTRAALTSISLGVGPVLSTSY